MKTCEWRCSNFIVLTLCVFFFVVAVVVVVFFFFIIVLISSIRSVLILWQILWFGSVHLCVVFLLVLLFFIFQCLLLHFYFIMSDFLSVTHRCLFLTHVNNILTRCECVLNRLHVVVVAVAASEWECGSINVEKEEFRSVRNVWTRNKILIRLFFFYITTEREREMKKKIVAPKVLPQSWSVQKVCHSLFFLLFVVVFRSVDSIRFVSFLSF